MSQQDENIQDVMDALQSLAPTASEEPRPASQALARLRERRTVRSRSGLVPALFGRRFAWAALAVVIALVVAFSFPGVRAAASDLLGLFRVQKFAPVSISAEQLAVLEEMADSGLYPGEVEFFEEPGEPVRVSSLAEAEGMAGWQARVPSQLGPADAVYVADGASGRLTVNVADARTLMSLAGAEPGLIPDSLDGAAVNVTVYPAISQNWDDGVVLLQSPSPLVEYPEDVDVVALGQALLEVLGMEPGQARRLAESIEWTNTVLLPIPENVANFSEVRIGGSSGLALTSVDGQHAAVIWETEGMVFVLSGLEGAELVEIANSID